MLIRILDLFCGVGGVARGFHKYLREREIEYEYYAVDIDRRILKAHKLLNPDSITVCRDAYGFTDDELSEYDFIWASPPCETHSHLNFYNRNVKEPDMRLYELIGRLYGLNIPFVVENVEPYYRPPIKPTVKVCRHVLWSNLSIKPFKIELPNFTDVKDDLKLLADYHELKFPKIKKVLGTVRKTRDALRDMVHWKVAYRIAEQVIPQVLDGRKVVQLVLSCSCSSLAREEGG